MSFPNGKRLQLLLAVLLSSSALAQNYTLVRETLDGGSGARSGPHFTLQGTIGQPDAAPLVAGNHYRLSPGFWSDSVNQPSADGLFRDSFEQ